MSPFFFNRMLRSPAKHICAALVSLVLAGLLSFLSVYRARQEAKLDEAIKSSEVLCVVTNTAGTQSTSLRMGWGAAQAVTLEDRCRLPEFVKDIRMTKELKADLYSNGEDGPVPIGGDLALTAVTRPEGIDELDPALGGSVTLFYEDFYSSEEPLIIVSEEVWDKLNGETAVCGTVTDPQVDKKLFPDEPQKGVGEAEFTVAGYYSGRGSAVFMPFEAGELIVDRITGWRTVDSLAFLAADNRRLDELKEAASEFFGPVIPNGVSGEYRYAITVHDEDLNSTVEALSRNIARTDALIPIALALTLAAGFLMGFISTRNEKNTYALSRSAGMTKRRLLISALIEQLILPFAACVITGAAFRAPLPALAVLGLYSVGCFIAVIRAVRVSPARLLREQD